MIKCIFKTLCLATSFKSPITPQENSLNLLVLRNKIPANQPIKTPSSQ